MKSVALLLAAVSLELGVFSCGAQWDTRAFCNPCWYFNASTADCSPLKCPILQLPPQNRFIGYDQDVNQTLFYRLLAGGNVNGFTGTAFQVGLLSGDFSSATLINYETGPRYYEVRLNITDDGAPWNVSLTTTFLIFVDVIDVNDPPLLTSPNVTGSSQFR
jgi:hypothetical protein